MKGDFEVISKPHVPIWRQGKKVSRQPIAESVMGLASVVGLMLVWSPWRGSDEARTAISVQWARGDIVAGAVFLFMGVVLALMAMRLWRARRLFSAFLMGVEVAALASLALTSPSSMEHLLTFGAVALASAGWLVVLAFDLEDGWLHVAGFASVVSLGVIPVSLGIGERMLITSCLVGMNLMFFRHFD